MGILLITQKATPNKSGDGCLFRNNVRNGLRVFGLGARRVACMFSYKKKMSSRDIVKRWKELVYHAANRRDALRPITRPIHKRFVRSSRQV